jgi:hypothetical protein
LAFSFWLVSVEISWSPINIRSFNVSGTLAT